MKSWEKVALLDTIRDRGNLAILTIADDPGILEVARGRRILCKLEGWAEDEEDPASYGVVILSDDGKHRLGKMIFWGTSILNIEEVSA